MAVPRAAISVRPWAATRYRKNMLNCVRLPFCSAELAPRRAATVARQPVAGRREHPTIGQSVRPGRGCYCERRGYVWLTDRDQGLFLELARELCPGCRILRRRVDRLHVLCRDDRVGRVRCGHCRALFFFLACKVWLARQRVGGGRGRLSRQAIRRARASSKHCHRQSVCGPG